MIPRQAYDTDANRLLKDEGEGGIPEAKMGAPDTSVAPESQKKEFSVTNWFLVRLIRNLGNYEAT